MMGTSCELDWGTWDLSSYRTFWLIRYKGLGNRGSGIWNDGRVPEALDVGFEAL